MSVIGISRYVKVVMTSTYFEFSIAGDMFGIFKASLYMKASYGSLASLAFEVSVLVFFSCKNRVKN